MAITQYTLTRSGHVTTVRVTSDLAGGPIYFHWYLDGQYCGRSTVPEHTLYLDAGDQASVVAIDTLDSDFDVHENAPAGWPARETLWWVRSLADAVEYYRIDQQVDGGAWSVLGYVPAVPGQWAYEYLTPRLVDLSTYAWRIVPVDTAGNEGTPLELPARRMVRRPDAPDFTITYNQSETTVTFSESV